jgi:hypothetical protein
MTYFRRVYLNEKKAELLERKRQGVKRKAEKEPPFPHGTILRIKSLPDAVTRDMVKQFFAGMKIW